MVYSIMFSMQFIYLLREDITVKNTGILAVNASYVYLGNAAAVIQSWNIESQNKTFVYDGSLGVLFKVLNFYQLQPSQVFTSAGFISTKSSVPFVVQADCANSNYGITTFHPKINWGFLKLCFVLVAIGCSGLSLTWQMISGKRCVCMQIQNEDE
jgi:hypothetical protein